MTAKLAGRTVVLVCLLMSVPLGICVLAQPPGQLLPPPREAEPNGKDGKRPTDLQIMQAYFGQGLPPAVGVTLADVLRLAAVANLDITQARLAVERARAAQLRAASSYLPNINIGTTYTDHEGQIQRTEGTVVTANRDSLFVGFGPTLNLSISDAIFGFPQARPLLNAAMAGQTRVTNDTLLAVADAYFNVLRARRRLARLDEVLDFLTSQRENELRGNSLGLLPLIKAFVEARSGLPSDQARVEADVVRRQAERLSALQDLRVAAAQLSRLLNLDATVLLFPTEDFRWPLPMPGAGWAEMREEDLVAWALQNRPELAENAALVEAALLRYQQARWRPALPNLVTTYSWGGFGGGPDLKVRRPGAAPSLGPSGVIADFGTRADWDISLVWRLQGMGLGNLAEIRDRRVAHEQTIVRQLQIQNRVIADVVQAHEQILRSKERIIALQAGLFDEQGRPVGAIYRSLRLNFLRIKGGQGLPLEALDSTRRLSDVLELYATSLSDYDFARYRLLVALGMPPAALLDPACLPPPPAPPAKDRPGVDVLGAPQTPMKDNNGKAEGGRQKAEGRDQKTEVRSQKSEARGQKTSPGGARGESPGDVPGWAGFRRR